MVLRAVLAIGIVAMIAVLVLEIRRWRAGASTLTHRQKALRVASASLTIIIVAMILAGDRWAYRFGPLVVMAYWTLCVGLALGLAVLALFDFREVGLKYGEDRKRALRNLAEPKEEQKNGE